jgi:hypothetical protein
MWVGGGCTDYRVFLGAPRVASAPSGLAPTCLSGNAAIANGVWTYPGGTLRAAAAAVQEIPITPAPLPGGYRFDHVLLAETARFAGGAITATKVSMGRPGSSTNDELLPQTGFMVSGGNYWFAYDRPGPPAIADPYSLVVAVRTEGGNVADLTGSIYFEACGYAAGGAAASLAPALRELPALNAVSKGPNQINLTWPAAAEPGYGYLVEIQSDDDPRYPAFAEMKPIPAATGYSCDPTLNWHAGAIHRERPAQKRRVSLSAKDLHRRE